MKVWGEDKHLDVCQNIEYVIKEHYELEPSFTDSVCLLTLHFSKIAVKQFYGYAENERVVSADANKKLILNLVELAAVRVGVVNDLTLKEYLARIEKIKQSVALHATHSNPRSYYEFIKPFLP
jgi:hypothetical protein